MAVLAVYDKQEKDGMFIEFLRIVQEEVTDGRNFVKKAVNWALRQVGKRNRRLNRGAIEAAEKIKGIDSKSVKWVAGDALRELKNKHFTD